MRAVPAGGALFGLAVLLEPREWRWLWELPALNPPNPVTNGMSAAGSVVYTTLALVVLLAAVHTARTGADARRGWPTSTLATPMPNVQYAEAHTRIGADTPVVYLAFGDMAYLLGNPTTCRYPSPVVLQRGTCRAGVSDLVSYRENLARLSDRSAHHLVIQRSWLSIAALSAEARAMIEARYDCGQAAFIAGALQFCPRR